jgi:hypothetical protein
MKKIIFILTITFSTIYFFINHDNKVLSPLKNIENLQVQDFSIAVIKQKTSEKKSLQIKAPIKRIEEMPFVNNDKTSFIPADSDGNLSIGHVRILQDQKMIIAHGDIIIGNYDDYEDYLNGDKTLAIAPPKLWKNGRIPYELSEQEGLLFDVTSKTIAYFNENTKLNFVPRVFEDEDYIRFESGNENCYSRLGRQGGAQIISLSKACSMQKVAHEILHSLGFLHEQNREDRDDHITIIWDNIEISQHLQFKKISNSLMPTSQTKFNFNSIMLYPSNAFSIVEDDFSIVTLKGEEYLTTTDVLNQIDLKRIELLYKNELNP